MTAHDRDHSSPNLVAPARRRRGSVSTPTGATVGEVFSRAHGRFPGLADQLLDGEGGLHKFVNVYRNDDDIRYLDQLDTKVADGDVISILPAVAGG